MLTVFLMIIRTAIHKKRERIKGRDHLQVGTTDHVLVELAAGDHIDEGGLAGVLGGGERVWEEQGGRRRKEERKEEN